MLVWNILLTLALVVEAIIIKVIYDDLYKWIDKFDRFMSYNPYNVGLRKKKDPYDSTPEFIEGIKSMVEELERPPRPYAVRYNQGVSVQRIEELEDRVDAIAEDAGGYDNRLDDHDSEINSVKDSIQEQNRRIDNLEKYCYGTKEKDDAAD